MISLTYAPPQCRRCLIASCGSSVYNMACIVASSSSSSPCFQECMSLLVGISCSGSRSGRLSSAPMRVCCSTGGGKGQNVTGPLHFSSHAHLSIGLYPFRKGLWNPAHFWTWKLHLLTCIPPGWGSRVFIHRPLHISGHGNSVRWPISLQGGAPEFLSTDPCIFPDMETPSIGPYPSREGHRSYYPQTPAHFPTWKLPPLARFPPGRGTGVFIHGPLHISRHGNSVGWPVSLEG